MPSWGIDFTLGETKVAGPIQEFSMFDNPCALGRITRTHQSLALHEPLKHGIGLCMAGLTLPRRPETIAHLASNCESVGYQSEHWWWIGVLVFAAIAMD